MPSRSVWIVASAAACGAAAVGALGCASSRAADPTAGPRRALAATESDAVSAASDVAAAAVERFLEMFRAFTPEDVVRAAGEVYAPDAYFNDGFAELHGADEIAEYLRRSAEKTEWITIEVADVARSETDLYVRWEMRFVLHGSEAQTTAPGISHLRVDRDGRVIYHMDYWDASGALADRIPLVGGVIRKVKSRL